MDNNGDAEGSYSLLSIHQVPDGSPLNLVWHQVGRFEYSNKKHNANKNLKIPVSIILYSSIE